MKIAIEIDNIVRDNNSQALKYFRKECDSTYGDDENEIDLNCTDLLSKLPFPSNESRVVFKEVDYPYELFGCAKTTHKHLHVEVEDWLGEHEDDEIIYFSLGESDLMIQSTYFFLSKGSRVRTVLFPKNAEEIWKYCDVAVTINEDVVNSKPENKKVIVIAKSDNKELQENKNTSLIYNNLISILKDSKFTEKLLNDSFEEEIEYSKQEPKNNLITKIKNLFNGRNG